MGSYTSTARHGRRSNVGGGDSFFRTHNFTRVPQLVQWMTTLRCALSCPHCLAAGDGAAPDEMSTAEASRLIEQVAELGVGEFLLTGGEPLVRPDFPEVIGILRANGVRWSLNTAVAPGRPLRKAIENWPPAFVAVSLDGPPEVHDGFRGRPGAFGEAVESISYFTGLAEHGVAAGTTVTTLNFPHLAATFGAVLASGATCWGLHLLVPEGRAAARMDLFLSRRQLGQLLRFAAAKRNHFPVTMADEIGYCGPWEPVVRDMPFFCGAGRAQCVVLPDGEVAPCTTLDRSASAGSVRARPLKEIWENGFAELRAWSPSGRCGACRYAAACESGCWLQRRHGTQCFEDVWRMPRMARSAAVAVCLGIAALGAAPTIDTPVYQADRMPAARVGEAEAGQRVVLQHSIIMWYASQAGGRGAPSLEMVRKSLNETLPDDPGAAYFLDFVEGGRPEDVAAVAERVNKALETKQRSLCLIGLCWRDLTEWCLDGKQAGLRTPEEREAVRELTATLGVTAGQWRKEVFEGRLDPFLRRPAGHGAFLRSKAGPTPSQTLEFSVAKKQGWTEPGITEAFLEEHPYGEVMDIAYEQEGGASLRCLRSGAEVPADGRLGVFDMLLVPRADAEDPVGLTLKMGAEGLTVRLPAGAELTYCDVLRLADEQNRSRLDDLSKQAGRNPSTPLMLPALRRRVEQLKAAAQTGGSSGELHRAVSALIDIYLF